MNGPKDKTKKKHDLLDGHGHPKETNDKAETTGETALRAESESPSKMTSKEVWKERSTASSSRSPPNQVDVDQAIRSILTTPGLAEHRYICLMEYSVLRAFLQNASSLALDPMVFADDSALSPWTIWNPGPAFAPHDLSPTLLQLSTPHHPYLDMIAPPSLRDNVLLSVITDEQEDQLCYEMHSNSFTIWGSQPWNALGM